MGLYIGNTPAQCLELPGSMWSY